MRHVITRGAAAAALGAALACGGGSNNSPMTPSPGGGAPGPSGATITIGASGVNSAEVTIAVGQSVTFVNNDSRRHDMSSDPHPTHTDCPQINAVGALAPGQSRLTHAFPAARTCGFHDHDDPENPGFRGRIIIR